MRNEAPLLAGCLAALTAQTYPAARMELVIADGGSADGTREAADAFVAVAPFRARIVDNSKGSTAAGFNAALRIAHGDVMVILGARARPAPSFIEQSVRALSESGADAVGGVVTARAVGLQAEAAALALRSRFGVGDARYRYGAEAGDVDTLNYGAYRRGAFAEAGGFDETMANVEDDEFNYRLRGLGKRLYLSPAIRCDYLARTSLRSLCRQYVRYGYPKIRVLRRHPRQMRPRQFIPALFAGSLLLTLVGSRRSTFCHRLFWAVAGAYAIASSVASLAIARRHGWRYLPLLPVAFAAMHLGYGLASLLGAVRFGLWPALRRASDSRMIPLFAPTDDVDRGDWP